MTTPIQLLLVDDHILFRESLRRLLASESDFDVVSDCGTIIEACAIVERCTIDVILLDFDLADTPASQCIPALRQAGYEGQILMVTAGMGADESSTALNLGVSGIFLKHHSPSMLRQAIRLVAGGATWVDQRAMRLMAKGPDHPADMRGPALLLTERDRRVLQGVFEGLGNKEIGARLDLSESAVKTTLQQLFRKTNVRTRSQLVRIALERSLATTPARRPGPDVTVRRAAGQKMDGIWPEDGWPG
jgi:two-component system, NarL family, nitrate/nitrite response regulator NarL